MSKRKTKRAPIGSPGIGGTILAYYTPSGEPVCRLPEPKLPPSGKRQGRKPKPIVGTEGTVEGSASPRGGREADYAATRRAIRDAMGYDS